jgi:hypothetical protein
MQLLQRFQGLNLMVQYEGIAQALIASLSSMKIANARKIL